MVIPHRLAGSQILYDHYVFNQNSPGKEYQEGQSILQINSDAEVSKYWLSAAISRLI